MLVFTLLILFMVFWTIRNIYVIRKERRERKGHRREENTGCFIFWV